MIFLTLKIYCESQIEALFTQFKKAFWTDFLSKIYFHLALVLKTPPLQCTEVTLQYLCVV